MHKKRSEIPVEFPLPRKGTKYVSVASHFSNKKMPLIFILRDILKIARTKHEVKKICLEGNIKVNGKVTKDVKFPVGWEDIIDINDKKYKIVLRKGKYFLEETKEGNERVLKVIGKKILKNGKVQANLEDGTNILTKEKFSVGDSFVLSVPENKLLKLIPLKENSKVKIIKGKHRGFCGVITSIVKVGETKFFKINLEGGKETTLTKESLLAIK